MNEINDFLARYESIAMAFYTGFTFLVGVSALSIRLHTLYKRHIERKVSEGKEAQRHEFQAGYFDVQEKRFDTMLNLIYSINSRESNNDRNEKN